MKEKYVVLTIFVVIIAHVYGSVGSNEVVIPYIIIYYGLTFFLSMPYPSL